MRKKPSTLSREFSHLVSDGQGLRLERGSFRFELRHLVGVTECQTDVIKPFHQSPPREIVHFEGNDVLRSCARGVANGAGVEIDLDFD